jgi:lysophospholipase L1-like esterase
LIIFYGSSSIRLWVNIQKDLFPLNVLNLGFGGSSFEWLNNYFSELFENVHPEKVILYGGDNDLSHGLSPKEIAHGFSKLKEKIQGKFPSAEIHGISIKPSPSRMNMIDKIKESNELIYKSLKTNKGANYIDIFNPMLSNYSDNLKDLFLSDELHMNKKGYAIWRKSIREYFKI